MDTDPALHQHYRNLQPHIQQNLQSHHTQHHPQHFQHQPHQPHQPHQNPQQHHHHPPQHQQHIQHQGAQHSPHQPYALQSGLDLSSLVNEEYHHDPREYNQDPRLQSHASSVQAQALLKGVDAPFYHQQSHSPPLPFEGQHGQQRHMQHEQQGNAHGGPHTPDQGQQQAQQTQQTHTNLRPYAPTFINAEQHNGLVHEGPDDVFAPNPNLEAENDERHTPIAPNGPFPQTEEKKDEDKKSRVGQAGFGNQPPPQRPLVPNPPDLEAWRQLLFDVNETITLSEEEYHTYFPHIDNVYSHRSTQKYKRKPFVSHYWDCRLKGRPPGTPKSDDPGKKKRKRTARMRDLCDVKIKITEFFEGAGPLAGGGTIAEGEVGNNGQQQEHVPRQKGQQQLPPHPSDHQNNDPSNFFPPHTPQQQPPPDPFRPPQQLLLPFQQPRPHPGLHGAKYFTIQRVNGNGGNGKGDGVAGPHKHTLADSDKVKKNSVVRWMVREGKGVRKAPGTASRVGSLAGNMKKASGEAASTIKCHSKALPKDSDQGVVLHGDCTDISSQRVWIALEVLNIPYEYIETSPKPAIQGLWGNSATPGIPGIRRGDWAIGGESAILEYLNEVAEQQASPDAIVPRIGNGNARQRAAGVPGRRAAARMVSLPNPDISPPGTVVRNGSVGLREGGDDAPWAGAIGLPSTIKGLLPNNPADRGYARHWATFVENNIVPAYNEYLRAASDIASQPVSDHEVSRREMVPGRIYDALKDSIVRLIAAAHPTGPFFAGKEMGLVDVVFAPIVLRLKWLLAGRGWRAPEPGTRWARWVDAVNNQPGVKATCCNAESYEQAWKKEKAKLEGREAEEVERRRNGGDGI